VDFRRAIARNERMQAFETWPEAFPRNYLRQLKSAILSSPHMRRDNLNRDFVGTRGFALAFRREGRPRLERDHPHFAGYLERVLDPDCNAFYLNPLLLEAGARVDPHIDRSLRGYCKEVAMPLCVSVLYVEVPAGMQGGELMLSRGKKCLTCRRPKENELLLFQGDLTHGVARMGGNGRRLSLVCEQYVLEPDELEQIPAYTLEHVRAERYA
jgi:hypothetical protein